MGDGGVMKGGERRDKREQKGSVGKGKREDGVMEVDCSEEREGEGKVVEREKEKEGEPE